MYDKFVAAAERVMRRTSTVAGAVDDRRRRRRAYRSLTVATSIRDAIRKALAAGSRRAPDRCKPASDRRHPGPREQHDRRRRPRREARAAARPDDPEQPRHVAGGVEEGVRDRARTVSGPAEPAAAQGAGKGRLDDPRVRRLGRRRQGRRDPAAHRRRSTREPIRSFRSRRRPTRSGPTTTCGASGATCRAPGGSRSSIAAGTAACWSSGSRALRPSRSGGAPTPRSTSSRSSSSSTASSW